MRLSAVKKMWLCVLKARGGGLAMGAAQVGRAGGWAAGVAVGVAAGVAVGVAVGVAAGVAAGAWIAAGIVCWHSLVSPTK